MQQWAAYRKKRGPLNVALRLERALALQTSIYANNKRDRKRHPEPYSLYDFTPYENDPKDEQELTLDMLAASTRRH